MCKRLDKKVKFEFEEDCLKVFEDLKKKLTEAPTLIAPGWELPIELIWDASDLVMGVVLGKQK